MITPARYTNCFPLPKPCCIKAEVLHSVQVTQVTMLDGVRRALEIAESMPGFTLPPKSVIRRFFDALERLME